MVLLYEFNSFLDIFNTKKIIQKNKIVMTLTNNDSHARKFKKIHFFRK